MELPAYHLPQLGTVLKSAIDRAVAFIKKAGTIIFVACIFIWFTSSYNFTFDRVGEEESILAFFGRLLAPIFAPLGWGTWRGAVATITGLVAKENVIGTFGILYGQCVFPTLNPRNLRVGIIPLSMQFACFHQSQ